MAQIITQYVLIIFLILGFAYLIYLLKDRSERTSDDYFGITYCVFNWLQPNEATEENMKKIIRAVAEVVNFVEANYKDEENNIKEEKALILARSAINKLNFTNEIYDDSIKYLIRLACAFLSPTNKIL